MRISAGYSTVDIVIELYPGNSSFYTVANVSECLKRLCCLFHSPASPRVTELTDIPIQGVRKFGAKDQDGSEELTDQI